MHFTWVRAILKNPFQDHRNLHRKGWVIHSSFSLASLLSITLPSLLCLVLWSLISLWVHLTYLTRNREVRIQLQVVLHPCVQSFFRFLSFPPNFPYAHLSLPFSQNPNQLSILWNAGVFIVCILQPNPGLQFPLIIPLITPTRSYSTHGWGSHLYTPLIISTFLDADQIVCCLKSLQNIGDQWTWFIFLTRKTGDMVWVWQST